MTRLLSRSPQLTAALVVAILVASCGSDGDDHRRTGIVEGTATQGPTCPVEQPGQSCEPAPVTGRAELRRDGKVIAAVVLDPQGRYRLEATSGDYELTIDVGGNVFPTCPSTAVVIVVDQTTTTDVLCDTGVR